MNLRHLFVVPFALLLTPLFAQTSTGLDPTRTFPVPGTEDIPRTTAQGVAGSDIDAKAPGERLKVPVVVDGQEVVLNFSTDQLERRLSARRQSFEFSGEPLDKVFVGLAALMNRGFEYPASLTVGTAGSGPASLGTMTLTARYIDMTPTQVFYRVARSHGFVVREEESVLRLVSPASLRREDLQVKVYSTKYVNLFNFADSIQSMLTPSVGKILSNAMRTQKSVDTTKLFGQSTSGSGDLGTQGAQTSGNVTVQSDAGRRDAVMPNNAFSVTIIDLPEVHSQIADFLAQVDKPRRQVAVSLRLYEYNTGNPIGGSKMGLDLSKVLSNYNITAKNKDSLIGPNMLGTATTSNSTDTTTKDGITQVTTTSTTSSGGTLQYTSPGVASGLLAKAGDFNVFGPNHFIFTASQFDFAINALETSTKARLRENPNVIAQHGVTTFMRSVENVPYVGRTNSSATGGGSQTESATQYLQIGTILNVTAWVEDDTDPDPSKWTMYLDLKPEISARSGSVVLNGNATPIYTARAPTTQVRIRNGDTVFLGGLSSNSFSETSSGVPFLKDIPLLGAIFGTKEKDGGQRELAMMVTAQIIDIDRKLAPVLSSAAMKDLQQGESAGPGFLSVDAGTPVVPEAASLGKEVKPKKSKKPVAPLAPPIVTEEDAALIDANADKAAIEARRREALRAKRLPSESDMLLVESFKHTP